LAHDPPAATAAMEDPAMKHPSRLAAAGLGPLSVAALAADRAAIKPGLWEFTHQSEVNGRPPIPDDLLAKMPPEARARMEAARQGRGGPGPGAGAGRTTRQCITDRDLDRGFRADDERQHCTHKIRSQTRTSMEVAIECADIGEHGGSGHGTFKWTAPSPEAMAGTVDMTMTQGAETMTTHIKITGRWLGADCGDVKPRPQD
jgi:hypothetical protein